MKKKLLALFLALAMALSLSGAALAATYTVQPGDNLSKIAEKYLGDSSRWKEIYEANKAVISNPNVIYVGQQLTVPGEDVTPSDPTGSTVVLTVDPNYEGALTYQLERSAGDPIFKRVASANVNDPAQRGYTFTGWFYDKAATRAVGDSDVISADTTIYAGWTAWDAETTAWMDLVLTEAEYARYICNRPSAYTKESFDVYQSLAAPIMFLTMGGGVFPKQMEGLVYALAGTRQGLVLADGVTDPEETIWYIWGDDMPAEAEADQYSYYGTWDNEGFKPFLVPYLQEDQSTVKGNLILVSGGGFQQRANRWEAYPAVDEFLEMGYNVYVLQRRVAPSQPLDSGLDLQRAIRYIRYHADKYGIAQTDKIACAGYSGGGMTITYAVEQFYGDIKPTVIYPDYKCDAVDQMNGDMQTMIMIYSASPLETENPNIPDALVIHGSADDVVSPVTALEACKYYAENGIRYEVHFFADAAHGFGEGFGLNSHNYTDEDIVNVKVWPSLADIFMSIQYGYIQNVTTIE